MAIEQDKAASGRDGAAPVPPDKVIFKTKATLLRLFAILDYERTLLGWFTTKYEVTPTMVRVREGIFRRREMDIPIRAIQDVRYKAGICGRLFAYGTLEIETAGKNSRVKLYKIQRAKKMRGVIVQQMQTI